ncbi:MAG: 4-hydroxy-tetrahydrodipicolinate synthase [SAR324 cluster bacterium]|uniref:4-hydroxy-tetrahydrodipicolinate synthase n=1 Tax=SAR324 cluster bacterium TaxID=2024889 RepID=A0A2A4T6J6_9DELT|nr:MAG: 4-hydroxy-tetrahydrodipicolinate synthase [SAR324 cluster bacterium]
MSVSGVLLPIITPFRNEEVDFESYETLLRSYLSKGISGVIPLGTTGEVSTLSDSEIEKIIETTVEVVDGKLPIYVGFGGNNTRKQVAGLRRLEQYPIAGILSACPYYNRPSQEGLYQHFLGLSENTDLDIILYNIPYRTGVNLQNETLFRLAELKNIVAIKDSSGDFKQSLELLLQKPDGFSVLTGEDQLFYTTLVHGGDGGIMASAHLRTEEFVEVYRLARQNDHQAALAKWRQIERMIPQLFQEPNPGPIKQILANQGRISRSEVRLPLTNISSALQENLEIQESLFSGV